MVKCPAAILGGVAVGHSRNVGSAPGFDWNNPFHVDPASGGGVRHAIPDSVAKEE
jgi:hypothetical protein